MSASEMGLNDVASSRREDDQDVDIDTWNWEGGFIPALLVRDEMRSPYQELTANG